MSFVVEETTFRFGGQLTRDFAGGSDAKRTFTVRFSDRPTNWADVEGVIGLANGTYDAAAKTGGTLPGILTNLPGDTLSVTRQLRNYTIKPHESNTGLEFKFEANYQQGSLDANPLSQKDLLSFDGSKDTEDYFIDESDDAKPVVNSAHDPFEKDPKRTTGSFKLVIEGNRAWDDIDLALYASYLKPNAVNTATFVVRGKSVGAGEGKMVAISVTPTITPSGLLYGKVRWEIEAAPDWMDHFVDRGFNELFGIPQIGAGQVNHREITKGVPPVKVDKPSPLDGSGHAQDPADPLVTLDFQPYTKKDFSVFAWTTGV